MDGNANLLWGVPFRQVELKIYSIDYDKTFTYRCEKKEVPPATPIDQPPEYLYGTVTAFIAQVPKEHPDLSWRIEPALPKEKRASWNHRYLPTSRLYLSEEFSQRSGVVYTTSRTLSEDQLEEAFAGLINQLWSSYSAQVLGVVQKAQAKGLADILKAILAAKQRPPHDEPLDPSSAYARVANFLERQGSKEVLKDLRTFQSNYLNNPQLRSVVSDINKVELRIEKATAPRNKLRSLVEQMFTGNKKVVFSDTAIEITGAGDSKIGLARLSSGEKQLIRIFIDSLLAGPSSIILDEPEISMHVDWQKRLVHSMQQLSPESQLIIATHSPEIMADLKDENIFRL